MSRQGDWVGKVFADVMGLSADASNNADRAKINAILRAWLANGPLIKVEGKYTKNMPRTFVEVGK